ncbi:MAG: PDZ domain-containing protein [Methylococcaceae bacterium]|nr:PDZ domain-containing protein [Methylococcaceae bacterium]
MVKKNGKAVVKVNVIRRVQLNTPPQIAQTSNSKSPNSLGSGFIVSKEGYIITNYHVIKAADKIIVTLKDRREFVATLIGTDEKIDIAVLKIKAHDLPMVKAGSPDKLKVGGWVVAIGSPYGFDQSVTAGIVSSKGRDIGLGNYVSFIQSDVAINPGNSGGPLFNLAGEVVGVNSQIFSPTGSFLGISFAIPIDVVMNVVSQLKSKGQVHRGWMGIQTQNVTRGLAESFSMKRPYGALISEVIFRGPADEAGFRVGDIVIGFNGKKIEAANELPPRVGMMTVGDIAVAEIIRQGERKTLEFEVGLLPEGKVVLGSLSAQKTIDRLGVIVSQLTADDRQVFNVRQFGVLVYAIFEQGAAYQTKIKQGDIILSIQGNDIRKMSDVETIISGEPTGGNVAVLVKRNGRREFLAVKLF